jgi:iron complex outermembrane receptor protein
VSRLWPALAGLFFAGLCAMPAGAQDVPGKTQEEPEEEVSLFEAEREASVLAATKTEIPVSKAPGSVTVITDREIRLSGARTIGDLLRVVAGVDVRWNVMTQLFIIRGFGENPFTSRVLLLIDGIPFNAWEKGGFPEHPGLDFFTPESIKRLEIIRSPNSALYGEDAYWGVINIVTLSGKDLRGGDVSVFGGTYDSLAAIVRYGNEIGDDGSILATAKFWDTIMPRSFWVEQDARNESLNLFAKATYGGLQVSYFRFQSDQEGWSIPLPPEFGLPPLASTEQIKQTINIAAAKFDQAFNDGAWSLGADFGYQTRNGHHCTSCHGAQTGGTELAEQENHGNQIFGELRFGLHKISHNDLLIGASFRRRDVGNHVHELGTGSPEQEVLSSYDRLAVYGQDRISLAGDKLNLYVGLRYDGETDLFDSFVSPRAHFVYSPSKSFVLRGGWSRARRVPNFYELFQDTSFLAAGPIVFARFGPNPDLEPEEIESFELGGEVRLARNVALKLDLFRSRVEKFITIDRPHEFLPLFVFTPVNHPDTARILGGEIELRGQLGKSFIGFVNYGLLDVEAENGLLSPGGFPLDTPYAPKHKINVGAFFGPYSGVSGSFDLSWRDETFGPIGWYDSRFLVGLAESPDPFPIESHAFINARLNYDLPFDLGGLDRPVRLSVYGRNLLDETPVEYGDFTNAEDDRHSGQEFFGEIAFRF